MNAKSLLTAAVCAAAFAATAALAAPAAPRAPSGTTVSLPVAASIEVANDQAVIELYVLEEGSDIGEVTAKAVKRAADGLRQLKSLYPDAELKTQSLTSTPRYTKAKEGEAPEIVGWQVRQSVSAKLADVKQAAPFVQSAQKYFAFSHVGFQLSSEARSSVQDQLVTDAIANLKGQARAIADALAGKRARIRIESVDFHNAAYERPVLYRMNADAVSMKAAASAGAALPVFEPGVTTLTRNLTAKVVVTPDRVKRPRQAPAVLQPVPSAQ